MKNDLIKVHKDFTKLNIGVLKEKELELFYYICMNVSEKIDEMVEIDFLDIRKALGNIRRSELKKYIKELHRKMTSLRIFIENEEEITTINLFDTLRNKINQDIMEVRVTKSGLYFFNEAKPYLRFLFSDVRKLNGKYAKLLVPYFMKESHKKEIEFEKNFFFNILEADEKYKKNLSDFNKRVLKPAVEELKEIFKDLKYIPLKNGRNIIGYKFFWSNSFNFQNKKETEHIVITDDIDILKQYWEDNFLGVNYTEKHKKVIEKALKNNSEMYVKNWLMEQWNFVQNSNNINNKSAYFSSLILREKSVTVDYAAANKFDENVNEDIFDPNQLKMPFESKEPIIEQPSLFEQKTPESNNLIEITEEEYNKLLREEIKNSNLPKGIAEPIAKGKMNSKYKVVEKREKNNKKDDDDNFNNPTPIEAKENNMTEIQEKALEKHQEKIEKNKKYTKKHNKKTPKRLYKELTPLGLHNFLFSDVRRKEHIETVFKMAKNLYKKDCIKANRMEDISFFDELKEENTIEFFEVFFKYLNEAHSAHFNSFESLWETDKKELKEITKTIDEKIEYIKNNLEEFKDKLLDKKGNILKGGALNLRIRTIANDL